VTDVVVHFPDPERAAKDYLDPLLPEGVTCGIGLPDAWTTADGTHVGVEADASTDLYPITDRVTLRVTVWDESRTEAKRVCNLARTLLLTHPGDDRVRAVHRLTGVTAGTDPDNRAPLATCTVRASLRPGA
jgi:hypothetical protein